MKFGLQLLASGHIGGFRVTFSYFKIKNYLSFPAFEYRDIKVTAQEGCRVGQKINLF